MVSSFARIRVSFHIFQLFLCRNAGRRCYHCVIGILETSNASANIVYYPRAIFYVLSSFHIFFIVELSIHIFVGYSSLIYHTDYITQSNPFLLVAVVGRHR